MDQGNENKMTFDKTHKFDNCKGMLDREEYLNKNSLLKSLKQSQPKEQGDKSKPLKNDPLYEKMTSLYSTMNEWISDSKNALSSSSNSVTKCKNTQNSQNRPEFRETPAPITHGDQAKITESHSRSIDLIDFNTEIENGETYFTHAQMLQNKRIKDTADSAREKDVEFEIERSVNKAIKQVRKIGDMVRSISEIVQRESSSASSDIAAKIKKVLQLVHQLKDEIPGNVQLLDSISQIERLKYQKEWGVISKNLDEMKILAKTIQSTLAGLH